MTSTPDAARRATAEVPAGADATTLSVDDAAGTTWTLTIPAGAFIGPASISMTPVSEISSADLPGPVLGGVMLEPEGTRFIVPATLSVTRAGAAGDILILADDDHGDVRLEAPAREAWSTVSVAHFSSRYAVSASDPAWRTIVRTLERDALSAESEAAILLNQPDLDVPEAPALPTCRDDDARKVAAIAMAEFMNRLLNPELDLIVRFTIVWHTDKTFGNGRDLDPMAGQLYDRLLRKGIELVRRTPPEPERFEAVAAGTIAILKASELFGTGDRVEALSDRLAVWMGRTVDATVARIASDHDYRQVLTAWWLAGSTYLLGSGVNLDALLLKLGKALSFDAGIEWAVRNPEGEHWTTSGTIPLGYTAATAKDSPFLTGAAEVADVAYGGHPQGMTLEASPFTARARLTHVDVCAGTARLGLDRFYSDNERYRDPDGGGLTMSRSWVNWGFVVNPETRDGYASFPVQLHNGSARWVDEVIHDELEGWTSDLRVAVDHRP